MWHILGHETATQDLSIRITLRLEVIHLKPLNGCPGTQMGGPCRPNPVHISGWIGLVDELPLGPLSSSLFRHSFQWISKDKKKKRAIKWNTEGAKVSPLYANRERTTQLHTHENYDKILKRKNRPNCVDFIVYAFSCAHSCAMREKCSAQYHSFVFGNPCLVSQVWCYSAKTIS